MQNYEKLNQPTPKIAYVDDDSSETTLLECYHTLRKEEGGFGVKLCALHAMARVRRTMAKGHKLLPRFFMELKLAMYELDMVDKEHFVRHLKSNPKTKLTAEQIDNLPLNYFHGKDCIKRRLRQPEVMGPLVDKVSEDTLKL